MDQPSVLLGPTLARASSWVISVPCPIVASYAFWVHNKQIYTPFSHSAVCQALDTVQGSSNEWELLPQWWGESDKSVVTGQWEGTEAEVCSDALAAGGGKDLLQ